MGILEFFTGGPKKDPVHLTDANFKDEVVNGGGAWIVDFWGPNCPWCDKLVPTIRILAGKYDGKVKVGEVGTANNPRTSASFGVKGTPTVVFIRDGRVVERFSGWQPQQFIEEVVEAHFGDLLETAEDAKSAG
jgi:thioredoxin 1